MWTDYVDMDGGDADILMSTSNNDGATWSAAQNVDLETDNGDDQFMPWVDVANGRVHVTFYGYDEESANFNVFVSYGTVAAAPALTVIQVNSQPTPAATGFLGDYIAIDVGSDDVAHPSWGDGRAGVGGSTDSFAARLDFSPPSSVVAAASPSSLPWGQNTTLTATVTGAHGESEQFIPVKFTVTSACSPSATSGNGTTNAAGKATFTYTNGTAGTDTVSVWADLDEDGVADAGETTPVSVVWTKHPTVAAYTGPASGTYHLAMTVSGTLRDSLTNTAIAGETLTIGFGTDTCTGVTNAAGAASCTLTPQQVPGPYVATASYAGSTQYVGTTSPGVAFTLNKRGTVLDVTGPSNIANTTRPR